MCARPPCGRTRSQSYGRGYPQAGEGGDVAAREVRVLRELLDPYRAHGELAPRNEREQIEAETAQVREVHEPFLRPPERTVHVEHERVHVVGRPSLVPDAPLDERLHVLHPQR